MSGKKREARLEIHLLGEMRIFSDGVERKLPPSRKTRALLAYLLLTGREQRRARLCAMFWDVADDPRGALRWSLSKIRGLVDTPGTKRLVADRENVRFEAMGASVDVLRLREQVAATDLESASIEELEGWASAFGGEILETLDLPEFDDYQAWCVAEREELRRLRAGILSALSARLGGEPERALPYARAWVSAAPLDVEPRVALLRLSVACGRRAEAEQHYHAGKRMLADMGVERRGELSEAWAALKRQQPALSSTAPKHAAPPSVPAPLRVVDAELVGRDAELGRLWDALEAVRAEAEERLLVIEGEPGVGKSVLLERLLGRARELGATVVQGAAFEGESGRPYGPWIDALRAVPQIDESVNDSSAALEPMVPDLANVPSGQESRDRLFARVSDFVGFRAFKTPLVVVAIDDVQWLDPASAELLHYVARNSRHRRVLIVLTARHDELADNAAVGRMVRSLRRDGGVERLCVERLGRQDIEQLLAESGVDVARVFEQSGGNPLFAIELARGALDEDLPDSLSEAIRERVARLEPETVDVLRWASALGQSFPVRRLEDLHGADADVLVGALETLERQALVVSAGDERPAARFAHGVVRQVVYAEISEPRRRMMHRRIAELLQTEGSTDDAAVAELARHAALSHDHALAAAACATAGKRCLRVFANDQAATLAQRGLRHARNLPGAEGVTLKIELMAVQLESRRPEDTAEARAELEALAQEALDLDRPVHARMAFGLLSYLTWEKGFGEAAARHARQADLLGRSLDPEEAISSMADSGRCLVLLEQDLGEANALLLEASARARPLGLELAVIEDGLGLLAHHQGKLPEAAARFAKARNAASVKRDHSMEFYALEHALTVELERGDLEAASILAARLHPLAEKLRGGSEAPFARAMGALIGHARREDVEAELEGALEGLRVADAKYRLAFVLTRAAMMDLERDEPQRAFDRASEALELAEILERPSEISLALGMLLEASRRFEEPEAAEGYAAELERRGFTGVARGVQSRVAGWIEAAGS